MPDIFNSVRNHRDPDSDYSGVPKSKGPAGTGQGRQVRALRIVGAMQGFNCEDFISGVDRDPMPSAVDPAPHDKSPALGYLSDAPDPAAGNPGPDSYSPPAMPKSHRTSGADATPAKPGA